MTILAYEVLARRAADGRRTPPAKILFAPHCDGDHYVIEDTAVPPLIWVSRTLDARSRARAVDEALDLLELLLTQRGTELAQEVFVPTQRAEETEDAAPEAPQVL